MTGSISSLGAKGDFPLQHEQPAPVARNKNSIAIATSEIKKALGSLNVGIIEKEASEALAPTTVSTSSNKALSQEEISTAYHIIEAEMAPFFPVDEEGKCSSSIFVFNEKGDQIELHENTLGGVVSDLVLESSHEKAKEHFVFCCTQLYGEAAVAAIYPQKEQEQPLTVARAKELQEAFVALLEATREECKGDLSKFDTCLAEQLKVIKEVKNAIGDPRPATPEEASYVELFSKQTGISPSMVYAGILAGGVLAASALTVGVALPVAYHAAMATASAHTSLLGATLSGSGTSSLAATVGGVGTTNAAAIASINTVGTSAFVGGVAGGAIGGVIGAVSGHSTGRPGDKFIGVGIGIISGMLTGLLTASYGSVLLNGLFQCVNAAGSVANSLLVATQSIPVTPVSVGAIAGGAGRSMWTLSSAGREARPVSAGEMLRETTFGALVGSLLGGLAGFINPIAVGGVGALIQISREMNTTALPASHDREENTRILLGVAGTGVMSGFFGGVCSAIAHAIVAAGVPALPAHLGIAAGSAAITGVTEPLSRPSEVVVEGEDFLPPIAHAEPGAVPHDETDLPVATPVIYGGN